MGRPTHYSTEIAKRCQRLIERFAHQVECDQALSQEFRGPLRTTFLLAMSTPMVVLPIERLYKPGSGQQGVADDVPLDAAVGDRVRATLNQKPFGATPFFRAGDWAYVEGTPAFPVAGTWPAEVFDELDRPEAMEAAASAEAKDIVGCLRNALSHGGVAYLDHRGRQSDDATGMLGFASHPSTRRTTELRLLRIAVDRYQSFLHLWTEWLIDSGVETALTHQGPGWFADAELA